MHKRFKRGFTIIEVTLVLAITGMLFVGIIAGSGLNITRQRYNDAVQNFAEFLRTVYSEVSYVQNPREGAMSSSSPEYYCSVGDKIISSAAHQQNTTNKTSHPGRTECAIYGKLVVFGKQMEGNKGGYQGNVVHVFDIVGRVYSPDVNKPISSTLNALSEVGADIYTISQSGSSCNIQAATIMPTDCNGGLWSKPQLLAKIIPVC